MKKTTSKNLAKKLAQYGAMVTAIGTVAESNGQVIYTDIADFQGDNNATLNIDLNNDTIIDFSINGGFVNTSFEQILVDPEGSNAVYGDIGQYGFYYPFALNSGDNIGNNSSWRGSGGQILRYKYSASASICAYDSNWCPAGDVVDKFLGLRFEVGGNTHYGWVRLDVLGTGADDWVVKDFAFEATPNTPITAGAGILSTLDQELNQIRISSSEKLITLENLPEQSNYRIFNLTGQEILSGDINQSFHSIDASAQSSGLYILELSSAKTSAVIRKKLILN